MKGNRKTAKIICGIIVVAMIIGILYLTFQTPEQTTKLSETVRIWLKNHGWEMTSKQIRSNVHIPMYFLLGLALFIFARIMKWKWYVSFLVAMGIALLDECIKVLIPTREFEVIDLINDFVGIALTGLISQIWHPMVKANNISS